MTENEKRLAEARAKYGDNHWWESHDLRTLAYYQLNEDIFCVSRPDGFGLFQEGLELLLGRPVQTFELGYMIAEMRAEAEAAWRGTPYSEEGKAHAMEGAFDRLVEVKGRENIIVIEGGD